MKILALNWNDLKNPFGGGAEVHLEELLRRLVSYGHEVDLFCSGFENCKQEEVIEGVRIIRRGNRYNFNLIAPSHLKKLVKKVAEDGRVAIRKIRRDANDEFKNMESDGDITEDDLIHSQKEVQEATDEFIEKINTALEQKEKEIMEV